MVKKGLRIKRCAASNNAVLDSFTFTLDTEGNITQTLHADGTKWVYTYDNRHRVTEGDLKDSGNNNVRTYGYTYDAANNVTAKTRTVTSPASSSSWTYAYDNANEQTSVTLNGGTPETRTYDDWGRMATRTQGTSTATFGYRYGGRLYSYATNFAGEAAETMQYRGDGRLYSRVSGETTKIYHYDRGWNAINEEDESGGLNGSSVYAPGAEVGERLVYAWGPLSDTVMAYAYHDQLGSTRVWRWQNKNLIGKNDFAPYGEKYVGATLPPRDYALHVQDPYTQMYHAPYREYAAGWARWTTRDPLGMVDGPNEYAYVGDGPTSKTDPLGLEASTACKDKIDKAKETCQDAMYEAAACDLGLAGCAACWLSPTSKTLPGAVTCGIACAAAAVVCAHAKVMNNRCKNALNEALKCLKDQPPCPAQ